MWTDAREFVDMDTATGGVACTVRIGLGTVWVGPWQWTKLTYIVYSLNQWLGTGGRPHLCRLVTRWYPALSSTQWPLSVEGQCKESTGDHPEWPGQMGSGTVVHSVRAVWWWSPSMPFTFHGVSSSTMLLESLVHRINAWIKSQQAPPLSIRCLM